MDSVPRDTESIDSIKWEMYTQYDRDQEVLELPSGIWGPD